MYEWRNGQNQMTMNDYPKFGVWPDAYYMTANQFINASSWGGSGAAAFERDKMLNGQVARMVYFDLGAADWGGLLPSDFDGLTPPPAGAPNTMIEAHSNDWGDPTITQDELVVHEFHVDWTNPANSTLTQVAVLPTTPFDGNLCNVPWTRNCIPQPGTSTRLDAIADRLMYRLQYRNMGDHETLVSNLSVDADGTDHSGVRWFEVRKTAGVYSIFQEGTHAPDADHRWMGSAAMDHVGNIALGYSVSSSSVYPSIRYTGRLVTDPLGTLLQGEVSVIAGGGSQTGANRWGDYSMMAVDPVDDCTFWYTQEYVPVTTSNQWKTRVAAFKFPSCSIGPQGTLQGVVTDATTSNGIVGALVQAVSSTTQTFSTVTGPGGAYSIMLPVDTYQVSASAYGYLPSTPVPVVITQDTTTTQDIALNPAPSYTVSGQVTDNTTGWPLYSSINISGPGYPGSTVWTDPVTGNYSVALAAGITYEFTVNAWVPGYTEETRSVGPLAGDQTENFGLTADPTACTAPGYTRAGGLFESFDGTTTPAGWTVIDNASTGAVWAFDDPGGRGNMTGGTGNFAIADSDIAGTVNMDTELRTPVLDFSGLTTVNLVFKTDFYWYSGSLSEVADVDVSVNGAAGPWNNVWRKQGASYRGPHTETIDISALAAGQANVMVRFHYYNANWELWWQVDDVMVGDPTCIAPTGGGLVVGNVFDANTGDPLEGADVTNDTGGATTTMATTDPAVPDSFYTLFSPAGPHDFTAAMDPYYVANTQTPTVVANSTVRQDFNLAAGWLSYDPSSLEATLNLGQSTTLPLTLHNAGGAPATFEMIELDEGVEPLGPFEKPVFVVKPFRQNMKTAVGISLPPAPQGPPYAAGDLIQIWPSNLPLAWGLAYDASDTSVWVSSPAANWGGSDHLYEYSIYGTPTGRVYPHTSPHTNGPADMAYNWNTDMMWIMNVNTGVANCIYEIDPASGYTGVSVCPGGGTGFSISQRGLAYDPSNDTWYAGGWNDLMIHHFDSNGTMLDEVNVGIGIAGLAYNPDTQHLFVVDSAIPTTFYVLDAANNYALLGTFTVVGFSDGGGAGLEFDCDGNLWAADQVTQAVFQFESGETTSMCARDVPWLSEDPVSGTVPAGSDVVVNVTLDASVPEVTQPGHYLAQLKIKNNTPYTVNNVPVEMTVAGGTLQGTVTDASTGLPIAGATVTANPTGTTATTGPDGIYSMSLPVGTYDVTASAYGYGAATATGVVITDGGTTTQDFALTPSATATIQGTVTDALRGWPLYAQIDIAGYPSSPIFTDPLTGQYAVDLVQGQSFDFTVNAVVPGYIAETRTVVVPPAGATEDFALNVDEAACIAPGYEMAVQSFFTENFDSATPPALPAGWAQVDVSGTSGDWATRTSTRYPSGQPPHSPPNLAFFNSWTASNGNSTRLYRTSGLDLSSVTGALLNLWMYHDTGYSSSNDRLQVQISTDGGTSWTDVGAAISRYDGSIGWKQHTVDISAFAGLADVRLGLLGISAYGNDVHIDDVEIFSTSCQQVPGGLVVGNVYDANTGLGINGATVSDDVGGTTLTIPTPSDPNVPDGFYTLFTAEARRRQPISHVLTASMANYGTDTHTVMVESNDTVAQDFTLAAGKLSAVPTSVYMTLLENTSDTTQVTLYNTGGLDASFNLRETAGPPPTLPTYTLRPAGARIELALARPTANTAPAGPWAPSGPVALVLDDGSAEDSIGLTSGGQFVWLNRFTPTPDTFPFVLDQISLLFGDATTVGDDMQLVVWEDTDGDGDPGTGANFLYSQNVTVQYNDYVTWNVYPLTSPVELFGPGDVLIGVVNRSGYVGYLDYPAAIDMTASQGRSWVGAYAAGDPPNPPPLPADTLWGTIDSFGYPGNWTLRGSGYTGTLDVPWLTESPTAGTVPAGGSQPIDFTLDATGLAPGIYQAYVTVENDTPYGLPSSPNGSFYIPVTLEVVTVLPTPTVTPTPTATPVGPDLFGWVFLDLNGDGRRQNNEQIGFYHSDITLVGANNAPVASTYSVGTDGWYQVNTVAPGWYTISATVPAGYMPSSPTSVWFEKKAGQSKVVNFGMMPAPTATPTPTPIPPTATPTPTMLPTRLPPW
jgi:hypothetical protein